MSGISAKTPFAESDKVITLINNVLSPHGFNRLIITLKFSFSLNLSSSSFWEGYPSKNKDIFSSLIFKVNLSAS